jgi:serine-type D-Ala-D-Ala carboxypeptidase (penicillin-binding protein 5/6)
VRSGLGSRSESSSGRYPVAPVLRRFVVALAVLAFCAPAAAATPDVDARAYIVVNGTTNEVLLAHGAHDRLPIASITKLMTALLTVEQRRPNELVTVAPAASGVGGSTIRLRSGERLRVRDLLAGALIQSANDAAVALAVDGGDGSESSFVASMNRRAQALGLHDTRFSGPDGLDVAGNYSSAWDVTQLGLTAMREPLIRRLVRRESATIPGGRTLRTWNDLLGEVPGVFGVKTGHTSAAGWNEIAAARGNGVTIYATILGSPSRSTRNADLEELLAFGMSRYAVVSLAPPGRVYGRVPVTYGEKSVPAVAARPLRRAVRIGRPLVQRVVLPSLVDLPVRRGDVLGELRVYERGRLLGRTALVAAEDRDEPSAVERAKWYAARTIDHIGGWFT